MKYRANTQLEKQGGVSLIEVLVTLVIISIGLLGTASLQVLSKRANFESVQRTAAAHLANDYLQRMRGNRSALADYLVATSGLGSKSLGTTPTKDCTASGVTCTNSELASYDQWQWERQLDGGMELIGTTDAGGLMEPTACVVGPAGGIDGVYEVAIAWRGGSEHVNPTIHDCGQGTGKYGATNEFRHVLVMQTYIDDN
jgi:type IV pilus assembly protein PilV